MTYFICILCVWFVFLLFRIIYLLFKVLCTKFIYLCNFLICLSQFIGKPLIIEVIPRAMEANNQKGSIGLQILANSKETEFIKAKSLSEVTII